MKQNGAIDPSNHDKKEKGHIIITETPVVQMLPKENAPVQVVLEKANGMAVNGKETVQSPMINGELSPRPRRISRLKL